MKLKIFYLLFLIAMLACTEEQIRPDCSLVLCAGNEPVFLEIILNGENAIANGTYTMEDISIEGDPLEALQVRILTDVCCQTSALVELINFDWNSGTYDYTLSLAEDYTVAIEVELERSDSDDPCCGNPLIVSNVSSTEVIIQDNDGYFTINLN